MRLGAQRVTSSGCACAHVSPEPDDEVSAALAAGVPTMAITGLPTSRLVMEITETALLADPETARSSLALLDRADVALSIDDFGHGHTALTYFGDLPVRELKPRGSPPTAAGRRSYQPAVRTAIAPDRV